MLLPSLFCSSAHDPLQPWFSCGSCVHCWAVGPTSTMFPTGGLHIAHHVGGGILLSIPPADFHPNGKPQAGSGGDSGVDSIGHPSADTVWLHGSGLPYKQSLALFMLPRISDQTLSVQSHVVLLWVTRGHLPPPHLLRQTVGSGTYPPVQHPQEVGLALRLRSRGVSPRAPLWE